MTVNGESEMDRNRDERTKIGFDFIKEVETGNEARTGWTLEDRGTSGPTQTYTGLYLSI